MERHEFEGRESDVCSRVHSIKTIASLGPKPSLWSSLAHLQPSPSKSSTCPRYTAKLLAYAHDAHSTLEALGQEEDAPDGWKGPQIDIDCAPAPPPSSRQTPGGTHQGIRKNVLIRLQRSEGARIDGEPRLKTAKHGSPLAVAVAGNETGAVKIRSLAEKTSSTVRHSLGPNLHSISQMCFTLWEAGDTDTSTDTESSPIATGAPSSTISTGQGRRYSAVDCHRVMRPQRNVTSKRLYNIIHLWDNPRSASEIQVSHVDQGFATWTTTPAAPEPFHLGAILVDALRESASLQLKTRGIGREPLEYVPTPLWCRRAQALEFAQALLLVQSSSCREQVLRMARKMLTRIMKTKT